MPPIRVWFVGLRAFILAAGGVVVSQFAQLSGTEASISLASWIVAGVTGLMAAANGMRDAWPAEPPSPPAHRHPSRPRVH